MELPDTKPLMRRIDALCAKHSYDWDMVIRDLNIVQGNLGVPVVRRVLDKLLAGHHYDLVALFADLLREDHRSSYRALGATFARKASKAPATPPELLRLKDRAEQGQSCFIVKFQLQSPWQPSAPVAPYCCRVFAESAEGAASQARAHAASLLPGGKAANLRVINILDDPDAELADVVNVVIEIGGPPAVEVATAPTFTAAGSMLKQAALRFASTNPHVPAHVRVQWEHGASYAFITSLKPYADAQSVDLAADLRMQIAFVFAECDYADRSPAENRALRARLLEQGAAAHCADIRSTCLLRDR